MCGKLTSSLELPSTFDERFKGTSVPLFIPDFNLLSFELDNFTLKVLYFILKRNFILKQYFMLKQNKITIL